MHSSLLIALIGVMACGWLVDGRYVVVMGRWTHGGAYGTASLCSAAHSTLQLDGMDSD